MYLDDDESEEQWRKMRHERDLFLKKQQESSQDLNENFGDSSLNSSQILKLGQKAIIINTNSQNNSLLEKQPVTPSDQEVKSIFSCLVSVSIAVIV